MCVAKLANVSSEFSSSLGANYPDVFVGKVVDWTDTAQWSAVFGNEFRGNEDVGEDLEKEAQWALYFSEYGSGLAIPHIMFF